MIKECGSIFNRHKWLYEIPKARICVKCGRIEIELWGNWVKCSSLDEYKDFLQEYKKGLEQERRRREEALEYVRNLEV